MGHRLLANRVGPALLALATSLGAGAATAEVVAVVSARNSATLLSKAQVADIFLGRALRFPDGSQAVPIDQADGSTARVEFYDRFSGKSQAQLNAHWSKIIFTGRGQPPREVASGAEVKKRLAENPNAIGYIEREQLDGSVKVIYSQ
jgi:ABC-type phosphate transport system substrate-binding protein